MKTDANENAAPRTTTPTPAGRRGGPSGPIDSRRLFAEANEVTILHGGELYRLRVTRNGKLILNK